MAISCLDLYLLDNLLFIRQHLYLKKDILQLNDLECDNNVKEPLKIYYVVILKSGIEMIFS